MTAAGERRNDCVSVLPNKLLAEAFYLTGDIENYGTGFVRVREWLRGYPEVTYSLEEMGDFSVRDTYGASRKSTANAGSTIFLVRFMISVWPA